MLILLLTACTKTPPATYPPATDPGLEVAQVLAAASSLSALGQIQALSQGNDGACWAYAATAKVTGAASDVLLYGGKLYPAVELDPEECGGPAIAFEVSPLLTVGIVSAIREASIIVEAYGPTWPCETYETVASGLEYIAGIHVTPTGAIDAPSVIVPTCAE
jgi:hypothetical protein